MLAQKVDWVVRERMGCPVATTRSIIVTTRKQAIFQPTLWFLAAFAEDRCFADAKMLGNCLPRPILLAQLKDLLVGRPPASATLPSESELCLFRCGTKMRLCYL